MSPYKQTNPVSVSSVLDRDAKYPSPVQGTTVWRNDLGALETYYGLYNVSTNPGGRSTAGWYQEPAGRVLQVAHTIRNVATSTTSTSPTATGLSLAITPKYANSKLIIQVQANGVLKYGGYGGGAIAKFFLFKNSSFLADIELAGGYNNTADTQNVGGIGVTYSETSGTTSSITYQLYFAIAAVGTAVAMHDNGGASITVWEVSN